MGFKVNGYDENKGIGSRNYLYLYPEFYDEVIKLSKEDESKIQSKGEKFNIFKLFNLEFDELKHSRLLAELLNTKGSHQMGSQYLRIFIEQIIIKDNNGFDKILDGLDNTTVKCEKDNIDILLKLPSGYMIIIENKINAYDQPEQLYRYYNIVKDCYNCSDEKIIILYLTIDGHEPSEQSVKNIKDKINCISYAIDIKHWLDKCIAVTSIENINVILKQYRKVILSLTGNDESEELMNNLSKYILQNKEYFNATVEISKALNYAKRDIMLDFFKLIKNEFKNAGYSENDIHFPVEEITDYYLVKRKTTPQIAIKVLELSSGLYLYFVVEIDWNLYYCFAFSNNLEDEFFKIKDIENNYEKIYVDVKNAILKDNEVISKQTENFIKWEYIYDNNGGKYDFKNYTQNVIDLIDCHEDEAKRIGAELVVLIEKVKKELQGEKNNG